jgi:RNA polymerase sigma-B factor
MGESTAEHGRSDRDSATRRLLGAYRTDGDARARDRLVQLYLPLVEALAHRHDRRGAEHDDLVQAGSIGLLNAIERYDPARGGEFAAFAVPTIAGEMKRHLRDRTAAVRLPRRLQEARTRLPSAREELQARLGRQPSATELGDFLGISAEEVTQIDSSTTMPADETAVGDGLDGSDDRMVLAGAFEVLDETDRKIVYLRFVRELSRRQTAQLIGISEAALARRTETALARLRGALEGRASGVPPPAADREASGTAETPKRRETKHSGRLLVRMPQSLHAELAEAAEREEVSMNQYITNTLAAGVGWHTGDHPVEQRELKPPPQWLPAALVTNIVVVLIAGAIAVILLIVALGQGL